MQHNRVDPDVRSPEVLHTNVVAVTFFEVVLKSEFLIRTRPVEVVAFDRLVAESALQRKHGVRRTVVGRFQSKDCSDSTGRHVRTRLTGARHHQVLGIERGRDVALDRRSEQRGVIRHKVGADVACREQGDRQGNTTVHRIRNAVAPTQGNLWDDLNRNVFARAGEFLDDDLPRPELRNGQ